METHDTSNSHVNLFKDAINIPNFFTLIRLLLIPFFFLALYYAHIKDYESILWWGRIILVLIVISDFLDGYLARRLNQMSMIGSLLDPLADKLFMTASFILLSVFQQIPPWLTILVVTKDIMVTIGWGCVAVINGRLNVTPSMWGKCATAFQFLTVCYIVMLPSHFPIYWLFCLTGLLTLTALLQYGYTFLHELSNEEESSPSNKET